MRWPWSHGRLGAVELGSRGNVFVTIVTADRRIVEGTDNPDGAKSFLRTLVGYLDKTGQEYERPSDPGVFPISAAQNRLYGFPEDNVGNLLFKRIFLLKSPRIEVVRTLAMTPAYRRGLVRVEMVGPGVRSSRSAAEMSAEERKATRWQRAEQRSRDAVTYVFGYGDGKFRMVLPDGQVQPHGMDRLDDAVRLMMGVYDPSR